MNFKSNDVFRDAFRFLLAGGLNTLLTSVVYFLAACFIRPTLAYSIAWIVGILFVAVFYPDKVFPGGQTGLRSRIWLVASTISIFLIGLLTLSYLVTLLGNHQIAFLITLMVTTALNFTCARLILRRG